MRLSQIAAVFVVLATGWAATALAEQAKTQVISAAIVKADEAPGRSANVRQIPTVTSGSPLSVKVAGRLTVEQPPSTAAAGKLIAKPKRIKRRRRFVSRRSRRAKGSTTKAWAKSLLQN